MMNFEAFACVDWRKDFDSEVQWLIRDWVMDKVRGGNWNISLDCVGVCIGGVHSCVKRELVMEVLCFVRL